MNTGRTCLLLVFGCATFLSAQDKSTPKQVDKGKLAKAAEVIQDLVKINREDESPGLEWSAQNDPRAAKLEPTVVAELLNEQLEKIALGKNVPSEEIFLTLLIARRLRSDLFIPSVKKAAESAKLAPELRGAALVSLALFPGTKDYFTPYLTAKNDEIQGCAVRAIAITGDATAIRAALEITNKYREEHPRSSTVRERNAAKSLLDVQEDYALKKSPKERAFYLLYFLHEAFFYPPPGAGRIHHIETGHGQFMLRELAAMLKADRPMTEAIIKAYFKEKPDQAIFYPLLLKELGLETPPKPNADSQGR